MLADFSIPATGTKGFVVENFTPSLYLLFENPLNDRLSLGYNVGAEWDGASPSPQAFAALCLLPCALDVLTDLSFRKAGGSR